MLDWNRAIFNDKDRIQLQVFNELLANNTITASEMVAKTGISAATVSRVFKSLKEKDLIKYVGKEKIEKGRSPELFCINDEHGYMMHYYFTATTITGYLIDIRGTVVEQHSLPLEGDATLERILAHVEELKDILFRRPGINNKRLFAAGFAIPGIVNKFSKTIHKIPDINPLSDTKFLDYAERVLKVPVIGNNVSWLAAIGEKESIYPFVRDMVYITITQSAGIGMGVVINNSLIKGGRNYAGEIGQTFYDNSRSFEEYAQGKGQLEKQASLQTLYMLMEERMKAGGAKVLAGLLKGSEDAGMNLSLLERAAMQGDGEVDAALRDVVKAWAVMIVNIDLMINPELIIVGGSIKRENQYIFKLLDEMISKLGLFKPEIRPSVQGENAQLIGSIHVLKDFVYNEIIVNDVVG